MSVARGLKAACLKIIITHSNAFIFMSFSPERIWSLIKFYGFYFLFLLFHPTSRPKQQHERTTSSRNDPPEINTFQSLQVTLDLGAV